MIPHLIDALVVATLVVAGVTLWTLRTTFVARGDRHRAAAFAASEAVLFVSVIARVISDLSPISLIGYGAGVAIGTYIGSWIDARVKSSGALEYRVVADEGGPEIAAALMERGWPVTAMPAHGLYGAATVLFTVIDRSDQPKLVADLVGVAPEAFWTVEEIRGVRATQLPPRFHQVGDSARRAPMVEAPS